MISASKRTCLGVIIAAALFTVGSSRGIAQQVTYYNFNAPQANSSQYSYHCSATNLSSNPLFCLNDGTGNSSNPSFIQDPAGGGTWATQMTPDAGSQSGSLWFSVPQVVSGGFNTWFEFRLTPDVTGVSYATADGLAFVIQNAQGGGGTDPSTGCKETGSGPIALGGGGGCLGYSGIDNSLALEFDTYYNNPYDPDESLRDNYNDDNHISLQDCGAGKVNSSAHIASDSGPACEVYLQGDTQIPTLVSNPSSSAAPPATGTPIVLSDGNVHQVVVVYNGPHDMPANYLYVYLDPVFNPGTVTPVTGSIPLFSGPYDITQALNLMDTGSGPNSAFVGFTSATGAAFEQNELVAWTFTPHTPVTQQQPLQPVGSPTYTQFPFGTHTYAVQYPASPSGNACSGNNDTANVNMTVTANTVSTGLFSTLIAGTPFAGSTCQVYDDTGGNCVIYSASCSCTGTGQPVACPAATVTNCQGANAALCINIKTTYNNASTPLAPGFIQGDPFFSPVATLSVSGGNAAITCTGECSVVQNPDSSFTPATVTVIGAQPAALNGTYTITGVTAPNSITASTTVPDNAATPGNAGYLTSSNVKNIFTSWTAANIDGTSSGKSTSFSDFVFTDNTVTPATNTVIGATTTSPTPNQSDTLTATVTGSVVQYGPPTGTVTFSSGLPVTAGNTLCSGPITLVPSVGLSATATCTSYNAPATPGMSTIYATYNGDANHASSGNSLPINVGQATPLVTWPLASAITYGQTLASSTLSGGSATWNSVTVPGTFAFTTPTTAPNAGNPSESVTFTPGDLSSYNPATTTIPVQVNKAPVSIMTAPTASAILNGQTLASSVLSGGSAISTITSAVVPGTFTFTNPATAPGATGPQGITFTPMDTGDYLGTTGSVPVTVTAAPQAMISPMSIDFGTLYLGQIKLATVTIRNTGNAAMTISDPLLAIVRGGNSNEFVTLNLCPKSLAAGKSCTMVVTFIAGPFYTPQTATLTIKDSAPGSPQTVPLTATVINPVASFNPNSLAFGNVKTTTGTSTKSIAVTSAGGTALSITSVGVTGKNAGDFSVSSNCVGTFNPKAGCSISVTFRPSAKGARSATLVVTDNEEGSPRSIPLSGTGN